MEKIIKMLEELSEHCNNKHDYLWEPHLESISSCIRDYGQIERKIQNIIKEVKKCVK